MFFANQTLFNEKQPSIHRMLLLFVQSVINPSIRSLHSSYNQYLQLSPQLTWRLIQGPLSSPDRSLLKIFAAEAVYDGLHVQIRF